MNNKMIQTKIAGAISNISVHIRKSSPDIFMFAGIGGVIGGTILACIATIKAQDKIKENQEIIRVLDETMESSIGMYTKEDHDHDVLVTNAKTIGEIAMEYAPAIGLEILSVTSLLTSRHIMKERNLGLLTALTTVSQGFKEYRSGVKAKYGDDVDNQIRNNAETKIFEDTIIDENGKSKKVKTKVEVSKPSEWSPYAKFFDCGCNGWTDDAEYNKTFLILQQNQATDKLRSQGYLFLNDVYDMLGIPRTREGQLVGWIHRKDIATDNDYVDFGIYKTNRENNVNFVNGYEPTVILDFNVYGPIIDLI